MGTEAGAQRMSTQKILHCAARLRPKPCQDPPRDRPKPRKPKLSWRKSAKSYQSQEQPRAVKSIKLKRWLGSSSVRSPSLATRRSTVKKTSLIAHQTVFIQNGRGLPSMHATLHFPVGKENGPIMLPACPRIITQPDSQGNRDAAHL